ncbi:MAG: hypothetical protein NVS2B12_27880 [Ktedonobacteraceae bacterium]
MDWTATATIAPLTLIFYLFIVDWINLFPWNNVSALPLQEKLLNSLVNYMPLLFVSVAFLKRDHGLMLGALIIVLLYVILHVVSRWLPYFFGASEAQRREHQRLFGKTITILPPIKNNPIPNVEHMIAGIYMVILLVSTGSAIATANW